MKPNKTHSPTTHDEHGGFSRDLAAMGALADRRSVLRLLLGAVGVGVAACGPMLSMTDGGTEAGASGADGANETDGGTSGMEASTPGSEAGTACRQIPTEMGGPYPGDGTNSANGAVVNVLGQTGIVRSDIRSSFGALSGAATGVSLKIRLRILNASGCAPRSAAAVYLWHCDANGNYSLYSNGVTDKNYLRGLQVAGSDGFVEFDSIFPGCYSGRVPHVHFELFQDMAAATNGRSALKTSQLAFPDAPCNAVYATSGYAASVANFAATSLARDMVFSDGYDLQMATITGDVASGYIATLDVTV